MHRRQQHALAKSRSRRRLVMSWAVLIQHQQSYYPLQHIQMTPTVGTLMITIPSENLPWRKSTFDGNNDDPNEDEVAVCFPVMKAEAPNFGGPPYPYAQICRTVLGGRQIDLEFLASVRVLRHA